MFTFIEINFESFALKILRLNLVLKNSTNFIGQMQYQLDNLQCLENKQFQKRFACQSTATFERLPQIFDQPILLVVGFSQHNNFFVNLIFR